MLMLILLMHMLMIFLVKTVTTPFDCMISIWMHAHKIVTGVQYHSEHAHDLYLNACSSVAASSMICEFLLLLQVVTQYAVCSGLRIQVMSILRSKELGQGSKQRHWFLQGCVLLVESCGEARWIGHCLNCSAVVRTEHHSHLMFMYYYSKTFLHGDC